MSSIDDLPRLRVNPDSFMKSERVRLKWERNDLMDAIATLTLKRDSLLAQKQEIQKNLVSMPSLYHEKWDTLTKISSSHETKITRLIEEISENIKSIQEIRTQICQLEHEISLEISQRESSPSQFDFSDLELKIPKLAEVENLCQIKKSLNEYHLDRVYNAQLEISKFDHFNRKPSLKLGTAAASIAEDVNMAVRKGALSSHKMRAKVSALKEKSCQLEEQVRVEELALRTLRNEQITRENSRNRKISNTKALVRANLDTMRNEIIALNVTRRSLKQKISDCVRQHAVLCEQIANTQNATIEEESFIEEEEEEEEECELEDSGSWALESVLVKQRRSLEEDIKFTQDQIRKLRSSSKHRSDKLKREIAKLWNIETELRCSITQLIDNFR